MKILFLLIDHKTNLKGLSSLSNLIKKFKTNLDKNDLYGVEAENPAFNE